MAHQKVCKQGSYDMKVKVNTQSPILSCIFFTPECNCSVNRCRDRISFSGCHMGFSCLLNGKQQKARQSVHGNEATENVCS